MKLWIGAREISIEMIGARELWIGIDREGELIQRERESFNRKNEKEKWFTERERESFIR